MRHTFSLMVVCWCYFPFSQERATQFGIRTGVTIKEKSCSTRQKIDCLSVYRFYPPSRATQSKSANLNTLSDKNSSDKSVEISAWCRKFCPTKHFVRRKFCPIFQYNSQVKIGQNCRNFGLVSKILSDKIFCPSKILSDEILSDKVHAFL